MKPIKWMVYRNLNLRGVYFSIKSPDTGLVIKRTTRIIMKNCIMKVSQAGRERVLREKRKNVHAYIVGEPLQRLPRSGHYLRKYDKLKIQYNPYAAPHFQTTTGDPIFQADYIDIQNGVVTAYVPYSP